MGFGLGSMRGEIYHYFDVGSLTAIKEMLRDESDADCDEIIGHLNSAAHDFDLDRPDEIAASKIKKSFKHSADGWSRSIREDVAKFAAWTRKVALSEGWDDTPSISLPYIMKRVEANLQGKTSPHIKTDALIARVDRAGLAIWEWMGKLESSSKGIKYMGELVSLTEEEAFGKYYPEEYNDVKDIVQKTVNFLMRKDGVCFDYWKAGSYIKSPAITL